MVWESFFVNGRGNNGGGVVDLRVDIGKSHPSSRSHGHRTGCIPYVFHITKHSHLSRF